MKKAIAILIMSLFSVNTSALDFHWNGTREGYQAKIETYLSKRFVTTNPKKYQGKLYHKALTYVPTVLDVCSQKDINPSLVASIISFESNWSLKAIDKTGLAKGLMQVQFYSVDLNDPKDQIETGTDVLINAYNKCGSLFGALSYYATGKTCNGHTKANLRKIALANHIDSITLEK